MATHSRRLRHSALVCIKNSMTNTMRRAFRGWQHHAAHARRSVQPSAHPTTGQALQQDSAPHRSAERYSTLPADPMPHWGTTPNAHDPGHRSGGSGVQPHCDTQPAQFAEAARSTSPQWLPYVDVGLVQAQQLVQHVHAQAARTGGHTSPAQAAADLQRCQADLARMTAQRDLALQQVCSMHGLVCCLQLQNKSTFVWTPPVQSVLLVVFEGPAVTSSERNER